MFEKQVIPYNFFDKCEILDIKRYVVVNKFTEESYRKFCENCEKILNTGQKFIPIVIDSYGGEVYSLLAMMNFINSCGVDVITICESKCMSGGSFLFSCGKERYMAPDSTIMIHEMSDSLNGKNVELQNDIKEVARLNKRLYKILDYNTDQKDGYWKNLNYKNKYADLYMTAKTAKKHNLATSLVVPHLETTVIVETKLI